MKKRILTIVVIFALLISLFSLTASATTPEPYTEWELSSDGNILTKNGEEEFTRFELNEMFRLSEELFIYQNEVYLESEGYYTTVYSGKKDADVVYLYYGDNVVAYCNKKGAKELDKYLLGEIAKGEIYSYIDYATATTSAEFAKSLLSLTTTNGYANVSYRDIMYADSYDVELYSADGCLYYVLGEVFAVDRGYYFVCYDGPLRAYKLSGDNLTQFKAYIENMRPYETNYTYEDSVSVDDNFDLNLDEQSAMAIIIVLISIFGIALPLVPAIISLIKLFKSRVAYPLPYYVLFVTSVIWCVLGIAGLIVLLI